MTIMMTLFDDEQIMRTYLKNAANTNAYEADKATAERMIKDGEMPLEKSLVMYHHYQWKN
jgi:hypothetical protein